MLGYELWKDHLVTLVKEYIVNVWEVRQMENYALPSFSLSPQLGSKG